MNKYGTLEEKQPLYKIHFTDEVGDGTLEAWSHEQYTEIINNLNASPLVDSIWTEYWDEEEGWQA